MLTLQLFRENKEVVLNGLKKKNFKEPEIVDHIIEKDEAKRAKQQESEALASRIKQSSKEVGGLMAKGEKEKAEALKNEVSALKEEQKQIARDVAHLEHEVLELLLKLPNLPHESVPEGIGADDNEIVFCVGHIPDLTEDALPHWDLAKKYNLIDFETGVKITGSGFPLYVNKGARLQRALISYFLDFNTRAGYQEYEPPFMVNEDSAYGTGQLPDKEGQMYHATADNFYLIPTAEVPLTNIYRDVIIDKAQLPVKMTAYTPCFRREAGSYGKDVRGLNRLHQFDKVELVNICRPEESYQVLDEMVAHVENLLKALKLPYRILRLCGGDMSFTSALTYDFEVYSAAQKRWLEVSSVSNFESYQSNRMKIRYKGESGKTELLHTLNGSSLALPRILACLLENNQQSDGIYLPEVLWPYIGKVIN
ncbi:MAG TPA: serine--tRNA ligase [Edaphocola sp.]|nr:serine--tRNA ligase [Edaphocola sp.]